MVYLPAKIAAYYMGLSIFENLVCTNSTIIYKQFWKDNKTKQKGSQLLLMER